MLASLLAAGAAGLLAVPPPSDRRAELIADCNADGKLTHQYQAAELRTALNTLPADVREYTDCYDVIQRQLLAQLGQEPGTGTNASSTSSGSFLPTPVIVVLVLLLLIAVTFGAIALRRRARSGP